MKISGAFFGKSNILSQLMESRFHLFCGYSAPKPRLLPLFPPPENLGEDEGMAVVRQMEQAIKREGKIPPVFSFHTGWESRYLADGRQNLLELWEKNKKAPSATIGRLFFVLRKIRAGEDVYAPKLLGAIFRGPFGVGAYAQQLLSWLDDHPGMKKQPLWNFCWKQLWHSPDPKVVQFSLLILGLVARNNEELFKPIVRYLSRCAEFTPYCVWNLTRWSDANEEIFSIAKSTVHWARYFAIVRLQPRTQEIRSWLIEQAYQQSEMPENFAYLCAEKGQLRQVLEQSEISPQAFAGASALLPVLIFPQKGSKGITSVEEAAVLVERYTAHAARMAAALDDYYALYAAHCSTEIYTYRGKSLREKIRERSEAILRTQRCSQVVLKALMQGERKAFRIAWFLNWPYWDWALKLIEQDFWENYPLADFLLPRNFYVEEIAAIFQKRLPLRAFRAVPNKPEPKLLRQEVSIRAFCYILDELKAHPGQGERLLLEGVRSGYTAHRELALAALEKWEEIPKSMKRALGRAEWYGYQTDSPKRLHRLRRLSGKEKRPPDSGGQAKSDEGAQKEGGLRVLKAKKGQENAPEQS